MTRKRESGELIFESIAPCPILRAGVQRALCASRGGLRAIMLAVGVAGVIPLAQSAPFPAVVPLGSLFPAGGGDGTRGFVLTGIDAVDQSGGSVSAAGDVNGDGVDDLIVGALGAAPGGDFYAGESYVVFGSSAGFPAVVPLASLFPAGGGDGTRGFVLTGIDALDRSGSSVSAAGDVNGDGVDDLIVGASGAAPGGDSYAGESYVVFGRSSAQ
jgi:hypothetical protein